MVKHGGRTHLPENAVLHVCPLHQETQPLEFANVHAISPRLAKQLRGVANEKFRLFLIILSLQRGEANVQASLVGVVQRQL